MKEPSRCRIHEGFFTTPAWMKHLRALMAAWSDDRCSRKAAALAYYALFSLAPLVVILVAVASWFVPDAAQGLTDEARFMLGDRGAAIVDQILRHAKREQSAGIATLIATAVLLFGATSAFTELKASLDDIWGVCPGAPVGWVKAVGPRLKSFLLVLALVALLLASLMIDAALSLFAEWFGKHLGVEGTMALQIGSLVGSYLVITLLFATVYKVLPAIRLSWSDVALSALLTASLFMVGRLLMAQFVGQSAATSVYGTASSLAVLLLWIYYSAMIFLLGVEIIKVWRKPWLAHPHATGPNPAPDSRGPVPSAPGSAGVRDHLQATPG